VQIPQEKEWLTMTETGKGPEKQPGNSSGIMEGPHIISYNLNEVERPGGMKARFKIRVETGRKAAALNAAQAQAIKELLLWARQHKPR
jgi:hypothetical protein